MTRRFRTYLPLFLLALALALPSCKRGGVTGGTGEYAYVSAQQVNIRDRLSNVYNKVAVLTNGERVEILERQKRFARVKTASGGEGWVELRYLVMQDVFERIEKLAADHKDKPAQSTATTRAELNMRIEPGRKTAYLYRLKDGEKIELLMRGTAEKPKEMVQPPAGHKPGTPLPVVMEDWWLVRNAQGRVGWVLGRMIDVDLPLEVAQYAEGQRIQAYRLLNEVQDGEKKVGQYLVLLNEPKDGLPHDFNQFRVFTWNVARDRYETAYRERGVAGYFPVENGISQFDEGTLPWFLIRSKNDQGQTIERKFKLIGPIVRRELSEAEKAAEEQRKQQARAEREAKRAAARAAWEAKQKSRRRR